MSCEWRSVLPKAMSVPGHILHEYHNEGLKYIFHSLLAVSSSHGTFDKLPIDWTAHIKTIYSIFFLAVSDCLHSNP